MKNPLKFSLYFILCIIYFFSADIFTLFDATPFFNEGHINNGLRLPVMGGALILFILTVASVFKITTRMPVIISGVIGIGTLGIMIFGSFQIGSNINVFQLLWYAVSTLNLVITSCILILISIGIIKENHLKRWE